MMDTFLPATFPGTGVTMLLPLALPPRGDPSQTP